ncbi:MAG: hypothetical protein RSD57_14085 [Comamonas sp.]
MLKKILAIAVLASTGIAHAYTPQAGTWVVSNELNGKPGRGLAIDVQGTTLVMQMYAYDTSGNATFYLTSGTISDHKYSGTLNKYRGGRYLGSGDISGQEVGNDGVVSMRFVSGTKGFIKFPNEAEKEISRFNFSYSTSPDSLKGIWLLTSIGSSSNQAEFVKLENVIEGSGYGTGLVSTSDFRFACENITQGSNAGTVICLKLGAAGNTVRAYNFVYSVNDGEGISGPTPATAKDILVVRRLTNIELDGTGVSVKNSEPLKLLEPEVMRAAFSQLVDQMNAE